MGRFLKGIGWGNKGGRILFKKRPCFHFDQGENNKFEHKERKGGDSEKGLYIGLEKGGAFTLREGEKFIYCQFLEPREVSRKG